MRKPNPKNASAPGTKRNRGSRPGGPSMLARQRTPAVGHTQVQTRVVHDGGDFAEVLLIRCSPGCSLRVLQPKSIRHLYS